MLEKTNIVGIFRCSDCRLRVQKPHSDMECHDAQNLEASSNRAYEVIETVKRQSEYVTITAQHLHRILAEAWREGYEKGKNVLRIK